MRAEREEIPKRGLGRVPAIVWPIAILLISLYVFWVLPRQMPDEPIKIQFSSSPPEKPIGK